MPKNIKLIKQLLEYLEQYQLEKGNADLKEFAIYLRDSVISDAPLDISGEFDIQDYMNYRSYPEIEFSTLLTGLFRFAKHYIKKAFKDSSLKTIDEFGFLASLLRHGSLLKNELINQHMLEISSGSEILKRLIRNGLVQEYADKNDKRAKRVSLTEAGRKEIFKAFDDMHKVSEIVIGNLTKKELNDTLSAMTKLTYFHQHIHENDRTTELIELHDKYIVNESKASMN
jgi:DNA-binding MarR family transcriptional regulator